MDQRTGGLEQTAMAGPRRRVTCRGRPTSCQRLVNQGCSPCSRSDRVEESRERFQNSTGFQCHDIRTGSDRQRGGDGSAGPRGKPNGSDGGASLRDDATPPGTKHASRFRTGPIGCPRASRPADADAPRNQPCRSGTCSTRPTATSRLRLAKLCSPPELRIGCIPQAVLAFGMALHRPVLPLSASATRLAQSSVGMG